MKIRIYPPMIAGFYLLIALGIDYFLLDMKLINPPYNFFGFIIVGAATVLVVWSISIFNKNKTTLFHHDVPTVLVTNGPFGLSRNPIYSGLAVGLLGIAIFVGTVTLFFTPPAFVLTINRIYIPLEEKKLGQVFGEEYMAYKKHVRRWL